MATIFSKIIAGEIPAHIVHEDEKHLAFLDVFPIAKGHVLVIPKKETDYIFDLEDGELQALMLFVKKVARGLEKTVDCIKVGVAVVGLEVPHVHVHLVPINSISDINFSKEKLKFSNEELSQLKEEISQNI